MIPKKIASYTLITSNLEIVETTSYYWDQPNLGSIVRGFINPQMRLIDGHPYAQGHLLYIREMEALDHTLSVNEIGELILRAPHEEAVKYTIDGNGDLLYMGPQGSLSTLFESGLFEVGLFE